MNLGEIRAAVRSQTQTLEEEVPDATVTRWVREAFRRTIDSETRWPFYEKTWDLVLPAGESMIASAPTEIVWSSVESFRDMTTGYRLRMIDFATADDWFGGIGTPVTNASYYSPWNGDVYLWPEVTYAEARTFRLRAHRKDSAWLTGQDADVPDCDERLHQCLVSYTIALAYAQQEAIDLEDRYMARWQRDLDAARMSIMRPRHERPLTLGPRVPTGAGGPHVPGWTIDVSNRS